MYVYLYRCTISSSFLVCFFFLNFLPCVAIVSFVVHLVLSILSHLIHDLPSCHILSYHPSALIHSFTYQSSNSFIQSCIQPCVFVCSRVMLHYSFFFFFDFCLEKARVLYANAWCCGVASCVDAPKSPAYAAHSPLSSFFAIACFVLAYLFVYVSVLWLFLSIHLVERFWFPFFVVVVVVFFNHVVCVCVCVAYQRSWNEMRRKHRCPT